MDRRLSSKMSTFVSFARGYGPVLGPIMLGDLDALFA